MFRHDSPDEAAFRSEVRTWLEAKLPAEAAAMDHESRIDTRFSALLTPLHFRNGITCRNRVAMAAMTHYSSNDDGTITQAELDYVRRRSGGVGVLFTACAYVLPAGKGLVGEPAADRDNLIPRLRQWAAAIRDGGAKAILQLHHGGGVCPPELVPGGDVVSPSSIATPDRSFTTPRALEEDEIGETVEAFGSATRRAIEAGFDGVELHGGYGYLPQQFFSPYTNRRADRWGGDREQRLAFPLAIIKAARAAIAVHARQPFLLGYRFTPEEALHPGLTMDDALFFVDALVEQKLDFIDVLLHDFRSMPRQGVEDRSKSRLCYVVERVAGRTIVFGGGSIYSAEEGVAALASGIDAIALGRAMIIEPDWVEKISEGRAADIRVSMAGTDRQSLCLPENFWKTIWSRPGWFPGTAP